MVHSKRDMMPVSFQTCVILLCIWSINGQVGLRTLPVTTRNRSRHDPFVAWPITEPRIKDPIADSFENELASIFRGVAYGATTEVPTTTTTTPKTTSSDIFYDFDFSPEDEVKPSSIPASPPEEDWKIMEEEPRPIQHQYIEDPSSNVEVTSTTTKPSSSITKSDYDFRENSWISTFGLFWQLYIYTCATIFTILSVLSLICLARLHALSNLNIKFYCITIYLFIFVASFFRSISFCYSPHNVDLKLPSTLASILFNSPTPFVVTAFSILVFMLISTARLKVLPMKLQSPLVMGLISSVLLFGSLLIDIICGSLSDISFVTGLRAAIQALTSGWNAALCIGYIFIHTRVVKSGHRQQREASRLAYNGVDASPSRVFLLPYLHHSARATLCASVCGLVLSILQVYGLMNTESLLNLPPSQPWIWFWFQNCCRFLEVIIWISICFGAAFPMKTKVKRSQIVDDSALMSVFGCKSCTSCSNISDCCRESNKTMSEDMYSTLYQSNHIARKMSFQHASKPVIHDSMASSGPFSRISTTLLPQNSKSGVCKSATMKGPHGDIGQNIENYSNFPRPSSLFLNEKGQVNLYSRTGSRNTVNSSYTRKTPDFIINPEDPYENTRTLNYVTENRYGHYPRIIENYAHTQIYSDPISANTRGTLQQNNANLNHYQYQASPQSPHNDQYQIPAYHEYNPKEFPDNARYTPLYQQIPCSGNEESDRKITNEFYTDSDISTDKMSPMQDPAEIHGTTYHSKIDPTGRTDLSLQPGSRGLLRKIVSPTFCSGGYSPLSSEHSNNSRPNNLCTGDDGQSDYLSENESPIRLPEKKLDRLKEQECHLTANHLKKNEPLDTTMDEEKKSSNLQNDSLSHSDMERKSSSTKPRPFVSQLESGINSSPDTIDFPSEKSDVKWSRAYTENINR